MGAASRESESVPCGKIGRVSRRTEDAAGNEVVMKKALITAGILLVAAGAMTALLFGRQIRAALSVAKSATMDEETIATKAEENAQLEQDIRQQYSIPDLQLTEEQKAAVADGSMTIEEAVAQLLAQSGQGTGTGGASGSESGTGSESGGTSGSESGGGSSSESDTAEPGTENESGTGGETGSGTGSTAGSETGTETGSGTGSTTGTESGTETGSGSSSTTGTESGTKTGPGSGSTAGTETGAGSSSNQQTDTPQGSGTTSGSQLGSGTEQTTGGSTSQTPAPPAEPTDEQRLQSLIAQLYVLRDYFVGQVDALIDACIDEFLALPEDQQTNASKIRIVTARLGQAEAMEADCDARVAAIVSQIREINPTLADQAQKQYEDEKALKKANLIAQYS